MVRDIISNLFGMGVFGKNIWTYIGFVGVDWYSGSLYICAQKEILNFHFQENQTELLTETLL